MHPRYGTRANRRGTRMSKDTGLAPASRGPFTFPVVPGPKEGGAIRGTDEKFTANPVTGTGSMPVPIATIEAGSGQRVSGATVDAAFQQVERSEFRSHWNTLWTIYGWSWTGARTRHDTE